MSDREVTNGEIVERLDAIAGQMGSLLSKEVYEARQDTLETRIKLEFAAMDARLEAVDGKASAAQMIALWALGLFISATIAGIVGLVVTWAVNTG